MWNKIKWYVYAALAVCAVIIVYIVFKDDDDAMQQLNEWMFDKRIQLVKEQISKTAVKSKKTQAEIEVIDKKIQDLQSKRESDNDKIDKASIVELKDLFKEIHS
jgi:peptidoglycan hydrolase CwlO-like protein